MAFILAYCKENQQVAHEIDAKLSLVGVEFDHIAGDEIEGENSIQAQLKGRTEPVLLLVSDNFLKSTECMYKALFMLQANEHTSQIQPVVIDGRALQADGSYQPVPTSFERVSNVIQYMNYWQERYLELRKLKREATDEVLLEKIDQQLKIVRSTSSEVGEFLRILRGSDFWTYDQMVYNDFELFFETVEAPQLHEQYKEKIKTANIVIPEIMEEDPDPEAFFNGTVEDEIPVTPEPEEDLEVDLASIPGMSQLESRTITIASGEKELNGFANHGEEITPDAIQPDMAVEDSLVETDFSEDELIEDTEIIINNKLDPELRDLPEEEVSEISVSDLENAYTLDTSTVIDSHHVEDKGPLLEKLLEYQKNKIKSGTNGHTPNSGADKNLNHLLEELNLEEDIAPVVKKNRDIIDDIFEDEEDDTLFDLDETDSEPINAAYDNVTEEAIQKGKDLIEAGELEEGLTLIKTIVDRFPQNSDLRFLYASFLTSQAGDFHQATEQLELLVENDSEYVDAYILLGQLAYHQKDWLLTKNYYEKAISLKDDIPILYYELGLLIDEHFPEQQLLAMGYFNKNIKLDPTNVDARFRYAVLLDEALDKPKKSLENLEAVVSFNPQHADAHYKMAQLYYQLNKMKKAVKSYTNACAINPEFKTPENDQIFVLPEKPKKPKSKNGISSRPFSSEIPFEIAERSHQEGRVKTVLITGATSGIGRATAEIFAENGYRLILTGRRTSRLETIQTIFSKKYNNDIHILPFDVRSQAAVKDAMDGLADEWRQIDILINNAGLAKGFGPINEGKIEDWETMIDTNVKGMLYMIRAISPWMVKRKSGQIINVSSSAGKEVYPGGNVYCATKHAVEALTKAMRIDLHKHNIRVSQVSPGHVEETEFAFVRYEDREKAKIYEDFQPLRARDVAESIFFIATRPPHVNIQDIHLFGTQQANSLFIDRSGRE